MTALRRRLHQPSLPFNLYWFCYSRSELNTLPSWLTNHASVRLVLPPKASPTDLAIEILPRGSIEPLGDERERGDGTGEPTLQALDVFEELIRKLDLKAPHLTSDPL